ncbi:unnamed protein product [Effrenium voratum]|nr:unnamed protein product [Effrenium voratum]
MGGKGKGKKGDGIGQPLPPWMRKGGKKGGGKGGGGKGGKAGFGGFGMGMGMPGMGMPPFGMQMPFNMMTPFGPMGNMPMMQPMMPMQFPMQPPMPQMQQMMPAMQQQDMSMQQPGFGMQPGPMQSGPMQSPMPGSVSGPRSFGAEPERRIVQRGLSKKEELQPRSSSPAEEEAQVLREPRLEARSPRKEIINTGPPPPLPPPLPDGTRQVLVTIPRPLTASSDGLDDGTVKIPEFNVTIDLPDWYSEAQEELAKPPPSWPPQVVIGVEQQEEGTGGMEGVAESGLPGRRASADTRASMDTMEDDGQPKLSKLQAAMQARQRAEEEVKASRRDSTLANVRSKLFPYILAVLFAEHVHKSGLKTIRDWASKMQTHFEDTCQMQMRNCISWLSRALRIFARTLIIDSHGGLELAPSRENSLRLLDAGDLTARQRLAIRAYVLFDVLMTGIELPPQPLSRFLSRLAQREGIMLYVPKTYFTDSERVELQYDARGGIYSQPQSRQHHQLVAGFLIPRALLGGLFASWVRTLEGDASVGAERGKRNLQSLGALIYLGFQKKYELIASVHDIPGLSAATSDRLTQFGLDKRLVFEVGELVEKLVDHFTQPDATMSMVERVQSNPFMAGNIKVVPRDRQGEGAEPAVAVDTEPSMVQTPAPGRKSIVDRIKSISPAVSDAASSVQRGAGRFRKSVAAGRLRLAKSNTGGLQGVSDDGD